LNVGIHHLTIKIPQCKSDQLRNGDEVVIVRTGSKTCPVAILENYLNRAGITHLNTKALLFRAIANGKIEKL